MSLNELDEVIQDLQKPQTVVSTLKVLITDPLKDESIIPYLEKLLNDRTIVLVSIPYLYAEVRYLAIKALASTYNSLGISKTINIKTLKPLDTEEIVNLAKSVNVTVLSGVEGIIKTIEKLREFNVLPTITLIIK